MPYRSRVGGGWYLRDRLVLSLTKGYNRSVNDGVNAAIQEDAQAIAVSSHQSRGISSGIDKDYAK